MRVGIVGAGGMGGVHARQYRNMPDVELSFFEPNADRRAAFAERWGAAAMETLEALLDRVDVVDLCTPTDAHLSGALAAIAAGKAVFVEKPMGLDVGECRQMIDAAAAAKVALMPGQVVRFFPAYERAHHMIKGGALGTPASVRTHRGGRMPWPEWMADYTRSGGVLLDLAVHDFDWLLWTIGPVRSVYARSVGIAAGGGPDFAVATLTFENGCIGHAEATWMDPAGFRTSLEVSGPKGMIEFDSRAQPALRVSKADGNSAESPLAPTDDPYFRQLRAFLDTVARGEETPVSPHDGLAAVHLARCAIQSATTGEVVAV